MGVPGNANALLLKQAAAAGGYEISRSVRFSSSDSAFLSRTPASSSNRKTWTWAGWVKRSALGAFQDIWGNGDASALNGFLFRFDSGDKIDMYDLSGSVQWRKVTTQVFRDASAWYHFVISYDTTNATAGDRVRLYVNGERITAFTSSSDPSLNYDGYINNTNLHAIGRTGQYNGLYLSGYLADIHFIEQALDPSSFGEFDDNGVWQPIDASGLTYGTNGFHLDFADNSTAAALGTDTSGNGNTWTVNNISVAAGAGNDSLVDSPTNGSQTDTGVGGEVVGNYATLNPLNRNPNANLANGNLDLSLAGTGTNYGAFSTFGVRTGKWYFEAAINSFIIYGITTGFVTSDWGKDYIGTSATAYFGLDTTVGRRSSAGITASGTTVTFGAGDIVGVAFNADAGTATIYKNGASIYTFSGIPANEYFPALSSGGSSAWVNFGQRQWAYAAPAGFKALCTTNLPEPTIADGSTVMDVALYTGNGSTQTISGLNFSPDLVWIKSRPGGDDNVIYDTVRGATIDLNTNNSTPDKTDAQGLTSFDSNGFSLGTSTDVNQSSVAYVGWCWDGGTSTSTNGSGTLSSQVRANANCGFSIVTYTGNGSAGATVGHGLGVAPGFIFLKGRNNSQNWSIYHASLGGTKGAQFGAGVPITANSFWNNTSPSSTVFTLGQNDQVNQNTKNFVAYCFASVPSFSDFNSFLGNGSSDGTFVFTGMKPKLLIIKSTYNSQNWYLLDAARNTFNLVSNKLYPNLSDNENAAGTDTSTTNTVDFLSNGFKLRTNNPGTNQNGATYIYAAFAEHPFATARAR